MYQMGADRNKKNDIIICDLHMSGLEATQNHTKIPVDARRVVKLIKSQLYDDAIPHHKILKDIVDADINLIAISQIDAAPIAIASASIVDDRPKTAWLQSIAVDPSYQGDGIGSRLIGVLEEVASQQGVEQIGLRVNDGDRVVRFYEKLGFFEKPDFGGSSAIVDMVKPLT